MIVMFVELYGLTVDVILVARLIALTLFLYVAWRVTVLQRKINHIEMLTEQNYSDLQIKLADAIGVAEDSVIRDESRQKKEEG